MALGISPKRSIGYLISFGHRLSPVQKPDHQALQSQHQPMFPLSTLIVPPFEFFSINRPGFPSTDAGFNTTFITLPLLQVKSRIFWPVLAMMHLSLTILPNKLLLGSNVQ